MVNIFRKCEFQPGFAFFISKVFVDERRCCFGEYLGSVELKK